MPPREAAAPSMLVAPVQSLMQSVPAKSELQHLIRTIKTGQSLEPEKAHRLAQRSRIQPARTSRSARRFCRARRHHRHLPPRRVRHRSRADRADRSFRFLRRPSRVDQAIRPRHARLDRQRSNPFLSSISRASFLTPAAPRISSAISIPRRSSCYGHRWKSRNRRRAISIDCPISRGSIPLSAVLKNASSLARVELSQFDQGTSGDAEPDRRRADSSMSGLPIASLQRFETEAKKAIQELAELAADP